MRKQAAARFDRLKSSLRALNQRRDRLNSTNDGNRDDGDNAPAAPSAVSAAAGGKRDSTPAVLNVGGLQFALGSGGSSAARAVQAASDVTASRAGRTGAGRGSDRAGASLAAGTNLASSARTPPSAGELHRVCAAGDVHRVRQLLHDGADVKAARPHGKRETALHCCVGSGPEAGSGFGSAGSGAGVRGARPDEVVAADDDSACIARSVCARLLLRRGANANATDADGRTPLHWAAAANDHRLVRTLLIAMQAEGLDPQVIDDFGWDAAALAEMHAHFTLADAIGTFAGGGSAAAAAFGCENNGGEDPSRTPITRLAAALQRLQATKRSLQAQLQRTADCCRGQQALLSKLRMETSAAQLAQLQLARPNDAPITRATAAGAVRPRRQTRSWSSNALFGVQLSTGPGSTLRRRPHEAT